MKRTPLLKQMIEEANQVAFSDSLWERPRVKGITIDGPLSKDLDDAIWIQPTETGAILSVHIADVSEFIKTGSPLDQAAIAQVETRYLSIGNIPMFPTPLSENRLSLLARQQRPTLTIEVSLNEDCQIQDVKIFESWIKVSHNLTYEKADEALQDSTSKFNRFLKSCYTWAKRLNQKRQSGGAISGVFTSLGYWTDEEGNFIISDIKRHYSHIIVQEFMVLANSAVAQWLADDDSLALYRNHTTRAIAPEREAMCQALLNTGSVDALRQQLQNWLNPAEYSPTLIGHFALNLPAYCHFTSPIRRLADLINHRIVKARLQGLVSPYRKEDLTQLSQHIAEVLQCNQEASVRYYKKQQSRLYQKQLQALDSIKELSPKDFTKLLKHAIGTGGFNQIKDEVLHRFAGDRLQPEDLSVLLFQSRDEQLQKQIFNYLSSNPSVAQIVINHASSQQAGWNSVRFVERTRGEKFESVLEVGIDGDVFTTSRSISSSKKQSARHQACLAWIQAYVDDLLVKPGDRIPLVIEAEPFEVEPGNKTKASKHQELSEPVNKLPPLSQLTAKEFNRLLKQSIPQGLDPLKTETFTRLNKGQLSLDDYYLLLFCSEDRGLQRTVLDHLRNNPQDAQSVMTIATSKQEDWGRCSFIEEQSGDCFWAWLQMRIGGENRTTIEACDSSTKRGARHQACLKWIDAHLNQELVNPEQRVAPIITDVEGKNGAQWNAKRSQSVPPILLKNLKEGQQFVTLLHNLCQQMDWVEPEYAFTEVDGKFHAECEVYTEDEVYRGSGAGKKKSRAKQLASWQVLEQLQAKFQQTDLQKVG
jgi:ribonuclease R